MDSIRVVITESDPSTRRGLLRAIEDGSDFEVVATCNTGTQLLAAVERKAPDVLVVDVERTGADSFRVLEALDAERGLEVIVIADTKDLASAAFDAGATDYLVKPLDEARVLLALDRVRDHIQLKADNSGSETIHVVSQVREDHSAAERVSNFIRRIVVKTRERIKFIDPAHVHWIEASRDNLILHTDNGKQKVRGTMKAMEQKLDPEIFVRIHRSAIINVSRLKELQPYFHGEYVVVLEDGTTLRMSRGRRDALEHLLRESF